MSVPTWIAVGLLGGCGALARFWLDGRLSRLAGTTLPWGTLGVNLFGAFALGVLSARDSSGAAMLLAGTALLGSFTTFSTWMFESHRLGEDGQILMMFANLALGTGGGFTAILLGRIVGGVL